MKMQDRIKAIRKHANMTQAEFATTLGLGRCGTANWEKKDAQIPTEPMQLLICKTFGIDLHWLKTGEGEMFAGKSAEDIAIENAVRDAGSSPILRAFFSAWAQLNDNNRAIVEQFVEGFVSEYQAQLAAESVARDEAIFDEPAAQEANDLPQDSSFPVPDDPDLLDLDYRPFMQDPIKNKILK